MTRYSKDFAERRHHDQKRYADARVTRKSSFARICVLPTHALSAPSPERDRAIESLDELRDDFLHFNVKGWSIDTALICERALECLNVAMFLVDQASAILWHDEAHAVRAKVALTRLRQQLTQY